MVSKRPLAPYHPLKLRKAYPKIEAYMKKTFFPKVNEMISGELAYKHLATIKQRDLSDTIAFLIGRGGATYALLDDRIVSQVHLKRRFLPKKLLIAIGIDIALVFDVSNRGIAIQIEVESIEITDDLMNLFLQLRDKVRDVFESPGVGIVINGKQES